ncbi:MAG: AAA family ATPase [Acidimicrobiales bacterium]
MSRWSRHTTTESPPGGNRPRAIDLATLGQGALLGSAVGDVALSREAARLRRLRRMALLLGLLIVPLWWRMLAGGTITYGLPSLPEGFGMYVPAIALVSIFALVLLVPLLGAGRSPHVLYRASEIDVSLDHVKGAGVVKDEVIRTLNLFLAHKTFKDSMGGTPRRGVLFEGPPGTGKTHMAKAMAREAGVPFLFVSSSAFQSMYYGQTNRKIRSYFRALRVAARREGGAIGFIEEIDAIGGARSGMGGGGQREGVSGVVNELLVQLQSFDEPAKGTKLRSALIDLTNRFLPHSRQLRKPRPVAANVLVLGATNRASDLDPALLRPGRFDRTIHFGLPGRSDRREIIEFYLDRKSHTADLDAPERRDTLAAMTAGYSPVMIEHLFDEALVWALRRGASALDWEDLQQAKMTEEIGLKQPVEYTDGERRRIATHEAGHATVAYLAGQTGSDGRPGLARKLEVLSIIKRADALGLLAHSDLEERFTRTRPEIIALMRIAMGGLVAEEQWFGEISSGPAGDLQMATTAACQMVGSLGMGPSLISYDAMAVAGANNVVAKVLSNDAGREAVEELLEDARSVAEQLVVSNAHILEALRDALLEREELVGDEILEVIRAAEERVIDLRAADALAADALAVDALAVDLRAADALAVDGLADDGHA